MTRQRLLSGTKVNSGLAAEMPAGHWPQMALLRVSTATYTAAVTEWITQPQAARLLGCHVSLIGKLVAKREQT